LYEDAVVDRSIEETNGNNSGLNCTRFHNKIMNRYIVERERRERKEKKRERGREREIESDR
jgi:hypothetical protein